jgi:protein-disulfide isomerase
MTLLLSLLLACGEQNTSQTAVAAPPAPAAAAEPAAAEPGSSTTVAKWKGGQLSYGEATEQVKGQLVQMKAEYLTNRYNLESGSLQQKLDEALFEAESKKRGMASIEDLLKVEVEDKADKPSDPEIQVFYEQVKGRLRGMGFDQAKPMLEAQVSNQKKQERLLVYAEELRKSYEVEISLPFPEVPRIKVSADDDPFIGPENAPVEIIQFAEFQCPYCGKAGESVDRVMKEYEGKVKMVFRDFPLSFHDRAIPAAVAANCAGEQGKYWEMHNKMMANQRSLEDEQLTIYAKELSLDEEKWNLCRKDPAQEAEVKKDQEEGAAAGVSGTPAFFINGLMLSGALPFEQFKEIIDRELEKG